MLGLIGRFVEVLRLSLFVLVELRILLLSLDLLEDLLPLLIGEVGILSQLIHGDLLGELRVMPSLQHWAEFHGRAGLDQLTSLLIGHTGQTDDDVLRALDSNLRLGHTGAVHALADDLYGLVELIIVDLLISLHLRGQHHLGAALQVQGKQRRPLGLALLHAVGKSSAQAEQQHEQDDECSPSPPYRFGCGHGRVRLPWVGIVCGGGVSVRPVGLRGLLHRFNDLLDSLQQEVGSVSGGELQGDALALIVAVDHAADNTAGGHHLGAENSTFVGFADVVTHLPAAAPGGEDEQRQQAEHQNHEDGGPGGVTAITGEHGQDWRRGKKRSINHNRTA